MKAFRGFRDNPPLNYSAHDAGLTILGAVADYQGVVFEDGTVAVRWLTRFRSTVFWPDYDTFYAVHGHPEYGTRIDWFNLVPDLEGRLVEVPICSMRGCVQPAVVWKSSSAANASAFCAEHDRQVRAELRADGFDV